MEVAVGDQDARVESVKGTPDRPIVRFDLAGDRDAAEALRRRDVTVPASVLPELDEDEWYHVDLVGCTVVSGPRVVGTVVEVLPYPANDVLLIRSEDGADDVLVPFVGDVVGEVDVPGRRIAIREDFL
jgi:16S rRNA processing protein RimM